MDRVLEVCEETKGRRESPVKRTLTVLISPLVYLDPLDHLDPLAHLDHLAILDPQGLLDQGETLVWMV